MRTIGKGQETSVKIKQLEIIAIHVQDILPWLQVLMILRLKCIRSGLGVLLKESKCHLVLFSLLIK